MQYNLYLFKNKGKTEDRKHMKSRFFIGILVIIVFALTSCGDKGDSGSSAADSGSGENAEVKEISSFNAIHGLQHFTMEKETAVDGTETFKPVRNRSFSLTIAEPLTSDGTIVTASDNKEYILIKNSEGEETYIRSIYFLPDGILAVISSNDAILYSKPNNLNPTKNNLGIMMIVIASAKEEDGFYEILADDNRIKDKEIVRTGVYVKTEDISIKEADVQSALLFYVAGINNDRNVKKELLNTAVNDYSSSIFYQEICDTLDALDPPEVTEPADGFEPPEDQVEDYSNMNLFGEIIDKNVNVREFPGLSSAILPVTLNQGSRVKIDLVTKAKYKIEGYEDNNWFKIEEPAGWVFGEFIEITANSE